MSEGSVRPRQRDTDDRYFLLVIVVLAFAIRWEIARRYSGEAVWDGHYYEYYARRIADGFGYTDSRIVDQIDVGHASCHYPVGFSAALGALYWLFGQKPTVIWAFNALTGAAVVGLGFVLARHALGAGRDGVWRARIAALLLCFHPGLCIQSALVMSEGLATATTLASLVIAISLRARGRPWTGALLGAVCLGVSALVRPPALFLVPFLLPWDAPWTLAKQLTSSVWVRRGVGVVVLCAAALVPILPWTARNCRAMDGCALVSTNGGWNLAIGAFPRATGRFETLRSSDGCREVTGQVQQDRCWMSYGLGQVRSAPLHWLGLIPAKLHYTFDHESFPIEYLHEAKPAAWPDAVRAGGRELLTTFHRVLVLLAAAAMVRVPSFSRRPRARRLRENEAVRAGVIVFAILALAYLGFSADDPWVWPLALIAGIAPFVPTADRQSDPFAMKLAGALVLTVAATAIVFFGEDRYHMVASPALCVLAAAGFRRPLRVTTS